MKGKKEEETKTVRIPESLLSRIKECIAPSNGKITEFVVEAIENALPKKLKK